MINIEHLQFQYPHGDFRLNVPDLGIAERERIAVVGASGSGKTTLLDLMAGILNPSAGKISVAGHDLNTLSAADRRSFRISRIGLIFQSFELLEYLTVKDNVLLPYRIGKQLVMCDEMDARVARLAAEMGLRDRLDRYPDQLSQGERQRAAICRALITSPSLILADEPTGNLDPDNKQRVLQLLLQQVANKGATLVMVTHDRDLLKPFDRIIDMRDFHGGDANGTES